MLKSKIHEGTVTGLDVYHEGSIAVDENIMDLADLRPYEKVLVADCDNNNRFETYIIPATRGSGKIEILGATAPLSEKGHRVNILAFGDYYESELEKFYNRKVIVLDKENKVKDESRYSLQQG